MIAIKYTGQIDTALPPAASCGDAAKMLESLAAAVASGCMEEEIYDSAVSRYNGEAGEPVYYGMQDIKISVPAPIVARAVGYALSGKAEPVTFKTKLAWPNEDRGVYQTVIANSFFEAVERHGRHGICIPVLRILQRATTTAQSSGAGSVSDEIVAAYLCSYYSSIDERFQAVFYPALYSWHASRDAVMFETSSALADGIDRTAVSAVSATSAWLGLLVDQSTPIPSLLKDFMSRTGQGSGIAPSKKHTVVSMAGSPESFSSTVKACLDSELPAVPNTRDEFTQQTIELIVADGITPDAPVSIFQLVSDLMVNMGTDKYTRQAWKDYCTGIKKGFIDVPASSSRPTYVSLLPGAQAALAADFGIPGYNLRLKIASAAMVRFMGEYDLGGAPDLVVLDADDLEQVGDASFMPIDASVLEKRKLSAFGMPPAFQELVLASMSQGNRSVVGAEDVDMAELIEAHDIASLPYPGTPADARHGGVTLEAAEQLSSMLALHRALSIDTAAPESVGVELYYEAATFVSDLRKAVPGMLCTFEDNWLATVGTAPFDPRVSGTKIGTTSTAIISKALGDILGIDFGFEDEDAMSGRGVAAGARPGGKMIAKFCVDMVQQAREGKIGDMIIGREAVIENVESVLLRRDKANPLLLAPAGAGKTAVVEGLAKKIANNEAGVLNGFGVVSLDVASLIADGPSVGVMGERIRGIMTEAIESNTIIFIDEIHTIDAIGSGDFNLGNVMKPYLARQGLKVIGATTEREYNYSIAKDKALARRFSTIHLPRLDFDAVIEVLKAKAPLYGKHHGVVYGSGSANIIALLAEDYMSGRETPDRELDILDVAGSVAASSSKQTVDEPDIIQAVKLLTSNKSIKTRKDIARELLGHVGEDEANAAFPNVAGQLGAKTSILKRISESKLDISSRTKPRNIFMFVGDSGVGKTYMAHEMAPLLDAAEDDVLSISLGEYQDRASHTRLIGAAPQYVGYQEGGVLTNFAKAHPGGIVILDEIDKCTEEIKEMFLGVFDTGVLQAADGSVADCKSMTFVCTANTGHGSEKKHSIGFGTEQDRKEDELSNVKDALKAQFGEPLLNRIDEVVVFDELTEDDLVEICLISYRKLVDKMRRRYAVDLTEVYGEEQLAADARAEFAGNPSQYDARTAWGKFEKDIVPKAIALLD